MAIESWAFLGLAVVFAAALVVVVRETQRQFRGVLDRLMSACDMTLEARRIERDERVSEKPETNAPMTRGDNGVYDRAPIRIPDLNTDPLS